MYKTPEATGLAVIFIGPCGNGKTSSGTALAEQFGCTFIEPDDHHSIANKAQMNAGVGLTDEQRAGWIYSMKVAMECALGSAPMVVAGFSGLKDAYRRAVCPENGKVFLVYLEVSEKESMRRLANPDRDDHYMRPCMVPGQFAIWEPAPEALVIDGTKPIAEILEIIMTALGELPRAAAA